MVSGVGVVVVVVVVLVEGKRGQPGQIAGVGPLGLLGRSARGAWPGLLGLQPEHLKGGAAIVRAPWGACWAIRGSWKMGQRSQAWRESESQGRTELKTWEHDTPVGFGIDDLGLCSLRVVWVGAGGSMERALGVVG